MKIVDKIVEYFGERKIKTCNIADINEVSLYKVAAYEEILCVVYLYKNC